jgi:hypothetical protein
LVAPPKAAQPLAMPTIKSQNAAPSKMKATSMVDSFLTNTASYKDARKEVVKLSGGGIKKISRRVWA